jgi:hypothetical protein
MHRLKYVNEIGTYVNESVEEGGACFFTYKTTTWMLWSQFSAIFANFLQKNWRLSQKPML